MSTNNTETVDGIVLEKLPNLTFKVQIFPTGFEILAYMSGKMKLNNIRVGVGDKVLITLDPHGGTATNRIIRRL